jgi:hypothetical protein
MIYVLFFFFSLKKIIDVIVRPFFARSAPLWRWDAEEGHGDPSRACIYLMPVELTAQTH